MERLQKVMAAAGIASRRKCERLIAQGRVKVNGEVAAVLGTKVSREAKIEVDGRELRREALAYYLLNKPKGVITTVADNRGRPTVMGLVPSHPRMWPVGRLDLDTEGLLLLTNDGDLTHRLLHPSRGVPKTYRATVQGRLGRRELRRLAKGIVLADGLTAPAKVCLRKQKENVALVDLTIHEGRKRQVRRMLAAVGCRVVKLERIRFGFLSLNGLARGSCRPLTEEEISRLKNWPEGGSKK